MLSDIHFGGKLPTKDEIKALAEAEAKMLCADPTNQIIMVMPDKDGKPLYITR